jgi:glycine/D-amino acid oxidase-like deaminating enzyme
VTSLSPIVSSPRGTSYDVVIVGGAVIGSSTASFLAMNPDFDGSVLVVERDTTYAKASTTHTNSCMRQQFSNELNIRISQFGADYVRNFRAYLGGDPEIPDLAVDHFGYMYLADNDDFARILRENQAIQAALGAGTRIMSAEEIADAYPFYKLDDIVCGSHNLVDEGYFDSGTMFDWMRKTARRRGVEYVANEVVDLILTDERVTHVRLRSGEVVACGSVVNAAGPRAVQVAAMAGLHLPVEPRRRYTFVFEAAEPLDRRLPLTIDPSGVHVRTDGGAYMAGCTPDHDPAVDFDDFAWVDRNIWEDKVWPALANRIPAFERVKVTSRWTGHYAHNTVDHNVIIGPHPELSNFIFANGFSGHGMQQSPAVGRGVAELVTYGHYRSLDMSPLGYERIAARRPFAETAII